MSPWHNAVYTFDTWNSLFLFGNSFDSDMFLSAGQRYFQEATLPFLGNYGPGSS